MRKKKVLVVDDEIEIVDLVSSSLSQKFDVTGVSDPDAVMNVFAEKEFDLVILDINLGPITGYDLCGTMRSVSQHTPVVFLSSLTGEQDVVRAYEVGGFDFICKPFRPRELQEKICKLISFYGEFNSVRESNDASQQVALDAMSLASKYGMIVSFLDTNVETQDIAALMASLDETCQGLGLHHATICYDDNGHQIHSSATPIEEKFIALVREQGRIVDHHQRSIFSAGHVSILIRNMPLEDPSQYGIIKDIFAPLVTGANSRVKSIFLTEALASARDDVINASQVMDQALSKQSSQLTTMISEYLSDIQSTLMILELSESQEEYLLSQADEHMKSIVELVSDQSITQNNLKGIIRNISGSL